MLIHFARFGIIYNSIQAFKHSSTRQTADSIVSSMRHIMWEIGQKTEPLFVAFNILMGPICDAK